MNNTKTTTTKSARLKRLGMTLVLLMISSLSFKTFASYPDVIHINGGKLHVQGIALDQKEGCMYCSFTSAFYKTDLQGNIIGSITGINGHLGAMTFAPRSRKVYASLEIKNDAIGRGIADVLGAKRHEDSQSRFYIAEIDVDKIDGMEMSFDQTVKLHLVEDAVNDYLAVVNVDGKELKHRYGCSGIDGITIGPAIGKKGRKTTHLYVAYGIYGDTSREDNNYNILVCYDLRNLEKPVHKYFVYTGNTRYGVQNLAYDSYSRKMFLAVYPGSKEEFPNYKLFSIDTRQKAYRASLKGVPYETAEVEQINVDGNWHFKWGSTGLCPLGDGRYYISHNGKDENGQYCKATMYIFRESDQSPFQQQ